MNALRVLVLILATLACAQSGCAKKSGSNLFRTSDASAKTLTVDDMDQIRWRMRAIAETYMVRLNQACEDLERQYDNPELRKGLRSIKILQMSAALSSAVGTQPVVNLLDLAAQITLMRARLEDVELPRYGNIVMPLVDAAKKSETDVWQAVEQVTSPQQAAELRRVIDEWRNANPDQRHVSYVRFAEFAEFSAKHKSAAGSGSLFSLLYIDPLAKLDPVAAEVAESRALAERLTYLVQRLPLLLQMQVDSSVAKVMESPVVSSVVDSTGRFSDATNRFSDTVASYPDALSKERDAALKQAEALVHKEREETIKQVDEKVTAQQERLFENLQKQQDLLASKLQTTEQVMDKVRLGIDGLKTVGPDAVSAADAATNRTIDHAFRLLVMLILLILIGAPIAVILTRKLARPSSAK